MARKLKTTLANKVEELLINHEKYRDNQTLLCCRIWADEITAQGTTLSQISAQQFLQQFYLTDKITEADSITRVWRLLQHDKPHLRGKLYNQRHNVEEPTAIKEIRKISSEPFGSLFPNPETETK